jgi:thymidylate kinase
MSATILSIGFEGPNRVGKGTQCALLQDWLSERDVPSLIVRGDGSRTGSGDSPGNPKSEWWQEVNTWLHTSRASYEDWDLASYRLARELIVWRERVLPRCAGACGQKLGVLLIDRSLLSRTMIPRAARVQVVSHHLYPLRPGRRGKKVSPDLVCPDLILNLTAPKHVLLSRLDINDPKYEFRKRLIVETCAWFEDAMDYIPSYLKTGVVKVDAARDREVVFAQILAILQARFESLRLLE